MERISRESLERDEEPLRILALYGSLGERFVPVICVKGVIEWRC